MDARLFVKFFLLVVFIQDSVACGGYKIKLNSVRNCGDSNQIVKLSSNSTTTVNANCDVFSFTCADVKAYARASAIVTMRRNNMVIFNGTENMCQKSKKRSELALVMMSACGLRCSMPEKSFCDNGIKIVTFETTKKLFKIFGGEDSLKTRVVVKHDTGSSCFEADLSIQRL